MLSGKYHMGSLVAVFLALGVGILIGGTMGQSWMDQTEAQLIEHMLGKYESAMQENQKLHKHIASLQMMHRSVSPIFDQKQIWWIKPDKKRYDMLALAASSLGAVWEEKQVEEIFKSINDKTQPPAPDIMVFTDSSAIEQWHMKWKQHKEAQTSVPVVIDASEQSFTWNDPEEVVQFMLYLKHIVEEDQRASPTFDIYRYSGLE